MSWYLAVLKNWRFFGRARRTEFWSFQMFNVLASLALALVDRALSGDPWFSGVYLLATFFPALAVAIRRIHDSDRTGLWLFLSVIPVIGGIVLFVFFIQEGTRGDNGYGPDPKAAPAVVQATVAI